VGQGIDVTYTCTPPGMLRVINAYDANRHSNIDGSQPDVHISPE
jgi:hypothetical protein